MKRPDGLFQVAGDTVRRFKLLTAALLLCIAGAIAFTLLAPMVLERIVDDLTAGVWDGMGPALLYFAVLALGGVFEAAQNVSITVFGQKITRELRRRMCAKLSRLPASFFAENGAGSVTSRFVGDVDAVDSLFTNGVVSMFADCCKVAGILAVVFVKSRGLGILLLAVTPLLFLLTRQFQKRMLRAQRANRAAVAKVNEHIPETIRNIRMIHSFAKEDYMERRYDRYIQDSYRAVEKSNLYDSVYSPIVIFISTCIVALVMVLSARGGGLEAFFGMTPGAAVAIIAYVSRVFTPLESIGMEIQNIQSAVAGVQRIHAFLRQEERPTADDSLTAADLAAQPGDRLRLEGVSFGYDADRAVLEGVSFAVKPGETATLVGRTGAGKSTVFRLLLGLYTPEKGRVLVCGAAAEAIPDREKRKLFGFVEQSFRMVPGTVADQITLLDPAISRGAAEEAARLVGLHESILALERGYDTPCTPELFSQGQFQLLSIARAVVTSPPILLLDEITANLDTDTERRVIQALRAASQNRTVLSISHRLYEQTGLGRVIHIGTGNTLAASV